MDSNSSGSGYEALLNMFIINANQINATNETISGNLEVDTSVTLPFLTASRLVETDASKNLISSNLVGNNANQVIVSGQGTATTTLSTPQDIGTASNVTFGSEVLTNATNQLLLGTAGNTNRTQFNSTSGALAINLTDSTQLSLTGASSCDSSIRNSTGVGLITSVASGANPVVKIYNNGSGALNWNDAANAVTFMALSALGALNLPLLTASKPLKLTAGKNVTAANIDLTTEVTGVLPIANGGTNSSTALVNNFIMSSQTGAIQESTTAISGATITQPSNLGRGWTLGDLGSGLTAVMINSLNTQTLANSALYQATNGNTCLNAMNGKILKLSLNNTSEVSLDQTNGTLLGITSGIVNIPNRTLNLGVSLSSATINAPSFTGDRIYTLQDLANSNFVMSEGTQTINGNKTLSGATTLSGITSETNTTDASSISTGAFVDSGGLGVAKKMYIGSDIIMTGANASNTGTGLYLGNVISAANYAGLQHQALATNVATNYALLQQNTGYTYVNAPTGQSVSLRNNNTDVLVIGASAITASQKLTQNDTTASTSISTGSLNTAGGLGVTKQMYIGSDINMTGVNASHTGSGFLMGDTLGLANYAGLQNSAIAVGANNYALTQHTSGVTTINSKAGAGGLYLASGGTAFWNLSDTGVFLQNTTIDSSSTITGSLITSGGVGIAKKLFVGDQINETATTDSSSTTTGTIVTAGGVGIAKKCYVGTTLNVGGLTASRMCSTDASKNVISVGFPTRATLWIDEGIITAGGGTISTGTDTGQYYNVYTYASTGTNSDAITWSCFLGAGSYTFYVLGKTQNNLGKVDWYMDGSSFKTGDDWYSVGVVNNVVRNFAVTITGNGRHLLKYIMNGKNAGSSNYFLTLTKIWFVTASDTTDAG